MLQPFVTEKFFIFNNSQTVLHHLTNMQALESSHRVKHTEYKRRLCKMKKENFVSLVLGTVGVILFGIGMCMCLLSEWQAFQEGVIVGILGAAVLLAMLLIRRKMQHKPAIVLNAKSIGSAALGVVGALTFGVGMCMAMLWTNLMLPGIVVGCVGIVLMMALIPLCKGLQ